MDSLSQRGMSNSPSIAKVLTPNQTTAVSVIVPLFNKWNTVARAIESALQQDEVCVEVIVVDDGSTDGSDAVVREFGDRVRLVCQSNAGPSAARNHGARLATADLLVFLDADDELLPGCLAAHARARREAPDVRLSIASFRIMADDTVESEEHIDIRPAHTRGMNDFALVSDFDVAVVTNIAAAAICIDKSLFNQLGGFDENLRCWEISDFMYRAALAACTMALLHGIRVLIHQTKSNSQFERTYQDLKHKVHFAHRVLDGIDRIPPQQRLVPLRSIEDAMYSALLAGNLSELRGLALRAKPYRHDTRGLAKLCLWAAMPPTLTRVLFVLRAQLRRFCVVSHKHSGTTQNKTN